jgi:hypothetical protein
MPRHIYIDPSHDFFNSDGLFDLSNPVLNRDGQLLPFHRLRDRLSIQGISVHTADILRNRAALPAGPRDYYSLGILESFERLQSEGSVRLAAFVIMEPPVVAPGLYARLPQLAAAFDAVYAHNIEGDGYSMDGVAASKLRRFYWPIPHNDVLQPYWSNAERMRRIVVINGNHNPHGRDREQYGLRIEAMAALSRLGVIDLYGRGWRRWWSRSAMWLPYWRNRRALMSIYKGACGSKFEVLAKYEFCLCLENMRMNGYISEKIFDCFYAGTIPLYLGAPDILKYIPADSFVDVRKFPAWQDMWEHLATMPAHQLGAMRSAARKFLQSAQAAKFYHSMEHICEGSEG